MCQNFATSGLLAKKRNRQSHDVNISPFHLLGDSEPDVRARDSYLLVRLSLFFDAFDAFIYDSCFCAPVHIFRSVPTAAKIIIAVFVH